eukprot:TRINITY_DN2165_c1_g1_i1.p1 TRINITY_DN2165_c1_g1~~TRINITY_DN2165_c1_g1_i1.p1  ORF type:complete len:539 (-),score=88.88 TRINITY_DN2165_c1_g1_i1:290-1807(-)
MALAFASQWFSSDHRQPLKIDGANTEAENIFLSMDVSTLFIVAVLAQTVMLYALFCSKTRNQGRDFEINLTEEQIQKVIEDYQPEPLGYVVQEDDDLQEELPELVFESVNGPLAVSNGVQYLNFTSQNLLGLSGDPGIEQKCRETIDKYGVGSCGPRGFYGTIDVHLHFEEAFSNFMGTPESIIYSYDLATIPSILPAFASKKDVMVLDESVGWAIQNGAFLSRADIVYFKHNDMEDLERCVSKIVEEDRRKKKPLNRRFIVVEGIYYHKGDLCPLNEVVRIKNKYKFRVVVDETYSFGVLGDNGRGTFEHWGLQVEDVDIICGSMGHALGSVGGWCTGEREIVDHQRLSGDGYCFSASLPPFLATAALGALDVIDSQKGRDDLIPNIRQLATYARNKFSTIEGIQVIGNDVDSISPLIHMQLTGYKLEEFVIAQRAVNRVVAICQEQGLLISAHKIVKIDKVLGKQLPSLRVIITVLHTEQHIDQAVLTLNNSIQQLTAEQQDA